MAVVPDLAVSVKVCTLADCPKPLVANGLCMMHYLRVRRTGALGPAAPMKGPEKQTKRCGSCKEQKLVAEFRKNRSRPDGLAQECKGCASVLAKAWAAKNPDQRRLHQNRAGLVYKYGPGTPEWAERQVIAQSNACAICARSFDEVRRNIDHDHATGERRGLLCHACNVGLGRFQDDPVRLEAAAAYLRRRTSSP